MTEEKEKPEKNYHPMSGLQKTAWGGTVIVFLIIVIPTYTVWLKREAKLESDAQKTQEQIESDLKLRERIVDLESHQKEAIGDNQRLEARVTENTDWRVAQEGRARERIKDQGFREKRLTELEKQYDGHVTEHVDSLKDANQRMASQIKELRAEVEELKAK